MLRTGRAPAAHSQKKSAFKYLERALFFRRGYGANLSF